MVKKGEKGTFVIYYTMLKLKKEDGNDNNEKDKKNPLLKRYAVFNIDQTTQNLTEVVHSDSVIESYLRESEIVESFTL